jgi:flavin-dependent dehydrogenase
MCLSVSAADPRVPQSAREIPVLANVDVVVVGGTVGAVAAATAARDAGASVYLVAPRTYLGEDLCGTLHLWQEDPESAGPLARKLLGKGNPMPPMHVKRVLSKALLDREIPFLFGTTACDVLREGNGELAGVVIADRAGRQAIVAKAVIDATERGTVARLAGADVKGPTSGTLAAERVILLDAAMPVTKDTKRIPFASGKLWLAYEVHELSLAYPDFGLASLAQAEQEARDASYRKGQFRASERVRVIWPDSIVGEPSDPLAARGVPGMYVLGICADLPRGEAAQLVQAAKAESLGTKLGQTVAAYAKPRPASTTVRLSPVPNQKPEPAPATALQGAEDTGEEHGHKRDPKAPQGAQHTSPGRQPWVGDAPTRPDLPHALPASQTTNGLAHCDIHEPLRGARPASEPNETIPAAASSLPVLTEVDVLVVGGGTTGAPAAIAAARRGAKVLVVEFQEGLGGTGTLGMIGKVYHGRDVGFSKEVPFPNREFRVEDKMEWFRHEIRQAGGDVWLGVGSCGVVMEGNRVHGAVVANAEGRGAVLAKVVIDATGNADVAAAGGAACMVSGQGDDIAVQGAGLPVRPPNGFYVNSDYLLVDETDMVDMWRALAGALQTMRADAYDTGSLLQTRERRRIVGDHVLRYLDQIAERTYPDSIVFSASDYDSHGYPSSPYFALIPHDEKTMKLNHPAPGGSCYTPYRCLLPKGLDGILVVGLGISMERDASAMVRMQRDLHNQGYAAGVAATMAVQQGITPRDIPIRELQRHLVETGALPDAVLKHEDSFPLPETAVTQAVADLALDGSKQRQQVCHALAVVLTHADLALPLLRRAHAEETGPTRLYYARVLGMLGAPEVAAELVAALRDTKEWEPRILQGSMAEYAHLPSPTDGLILALAHAGDRAAVPVLLEKLATLDASVPLSHHRALALALERLGDPRAAQPLAELLAKPGMAGHAMTRVQPLHDRNQKRRQRLAPLREIVLAQALYRCGDWQGVGQRALAAYTHDLRGILSRHAAYILAHP